MKENQVKCLIEHQATLFALLSKYTYQYAPESAHEVMKAATIKYGNERGTRMAATARANGDEIDVISNQAYGEWVPDYPGQMEFGIIRGEPSLQTYISKCAWCEAWKKHKLLEYGKVYCEVVDNAVFQGFNPEYTCTTLKETLSFGGARCEFDWQEPITEDGLVKLAAKKAELGDSNHKDFNFHTAHVWYTVGEVINEAYGELGQKIIEEAAETYCEIFGEAYFQVLRNYKKEQF